MQVTEKQLINSIRNEETKLKQEKKLLNDLISAGRETYLAKESIKEIEKKPKNIMVDLGAGVYAEAQMKDSKKMLCQFGEKVYKKETNSKIKSKLDKRSKNIEKRIQKTQNTIKEIENKINQLMSIMKQIEAEKKKNFSGK